MFKLSNIFKKKKSSRYMGLHWRIEPTKIANEKGVDDVYNKELVKYVNGISKDRIPYSEEMVLAIKDIDRVPIIELEEGGLSFIKESEQGRVLIRN